MTGPISINARFGRRHRAANLTGSTAIALALAAVLAAERAQAQTVDACGAVQSDGSITCSIDGNRYRGGVTYATPVDGNGVAQDLTVNIDGDVVVAPRQTRRIRAAIDLAGIADASVTLNATEGATVRTRGSRQAGVRVITESGDITITAPAIVTRGERSDGIVARTGAGGNIAINANSVRTRGDESRGIFARAANGGDVSITAGSVRTAGIFSTGIEARSPLGRVTIDVADVHTLGDYSDALQASGQSAHVTIAGTVETDGFDSYGAWLRGSSGDATLLLDGNIRAHGGNSVGADVEGGTGAALTGGGNIRVDGDFSFGARVVSNGGDAVIDLSSVVATGAYASGASASSANGNASVRLGEARAGGDYMSAASAYSGYGDASVEITGSARADGLYGAAVLVVGNRAGATVQDALATGEGGTAVLAIGNTTQITVNGTAASRGGATVDEPGAALLAYGLADTGGAGGDVFVTNNGRVVARGGNNAGLLATADRGITIDGAGSFETVGRNSVGIDVTAGGDIAIDIGDVHTTGRNSTGIRAEAGGNIELRADRIETGGERASGVLLVTRGDDTTIDATLGNVLTTGDRSHGVSLVGGQSLGVTLSATDILTTGDLASGVHIVRSTGGSGDYDIGVGSVRTYGDVSDGITLVTDDVGKAVIRADRIEVNGADSGGIHAEANYLDLDLTVGSALATGERSAGIYALGGNVTLETTGTIESTGAQGFGVAVRSWETAHLTLGGNVTATGDFATAVGVEGLAYDSVTTVEITGDIVSSGYFGYGFSAGGGGDLVATLGNVTNNGPLGAWALIATLTGDVDVTVHDVTMEGFAINSSYVRSYDGDASLTVTGLYRTSIAGGIGMEALGMARVAVNDMETGSGGEGVNAIALTGGDAQLTIDGTINDYTRAIGFGVSPAIIVAGVGSHTSGLADVMNRGTINTFADMREGIGIYGIEAVSLTGTGSVHTRGSNATAVTMNAAAGAIQLQQGQIATEGDFSTGADLTGFGDVVLDLGRVETQGIFARGVSIYTTGDISGEIDAIETAGVRSDAIVASAEGDIALRIGTISAQGTRADGASLIASGTATLEVAQGGGIAAARDAVALVTDGGATLINRGTLSADTGSVIRASGGAATIWNGGSVDGSISLTTAGDLVSNAGTMRLTAAQFREGDDRLVNEGALVLAGDLDFGAGNDLFTNRGTLTLAGSTVMGSGLHSLAVGPVSRTITGAEAVANSGALDLRSGVAGDTLAISGSFAGSDGSAVVLDVRFGEAPVADRLTVAGAATGSTGIVINPLDLPTSFQSGIALVTVGAGTRADAFHLASSGTGFFAPGLVFDAASGDFALVTAPSASAYRLLKVAEGARSAWFDSTDTIAAHVATDEGKGFWLLAGGNVSKRDQFRHFSAFGFAQDVNLGYQQDFFSTQLGYGVESGPFTFGITAGYGNSTLGFDGSADRATYDALNGGAWAVLDAGRFRASALVKYDHYDIRLSLPTMDAQTTTAGNAWGGHVEAGVRLGSVGFTVEPRISLSWQRIAIDPLALPAVARFDDWYGGRAAAGARVSHVRPMGRATLRLYAEADYVTTLGDGATLGFATGTTALDSGDERLPDHGIGKLGFEINDGPIAGFLEATGRLGEGYRGGGARVGLRITL